MALDMSTSDTQAFVVCQTQFARDRPGLLKLAGWPARVQQVLQMVEALLRQMGGSVDTGPEMPANCPADEFLVGLCNACKGPVALGAWSASRCRALRRLLGWSLRIVSPLCCQRLASSHHHCTGMHDLSRSAYRDGQGSIIILMKTCGMPERHAPLLSKCCAQGLRRMDWRTRHLN